MKYTVTWSANAERRLTELWLEGGENQRRVADAANEIDRRLSLVPNEIGEDRGHRGRRVYFNAPLGVMYHVFDDDRRVQVVGVWPFRTVGGPPAAPS